MSTRATYSSGCVWYGRRRKEKALPSLAPPGAGASGFSAAHICGAVATGVRVRAASHIAPDQEVVHIAAASANAIATVARGGRTERARGRSVLCALVAAEFGMAAQLCDLDAQGEAVFDVDNVREFTRRATATEVRHYMRQLRARNAFLHGIDAIAEICVASTLPEDLWMKDRLRESQKAKRRRLVYWEGGAEREVPPKTWEEIDVNKELYDAIMDAACHWRGGCRNAVLARR